MGADGIRDRRIRAGLSQQELAELSKCSISFVRQLEFNERVVAGDLRSPTHKRVEAALAKAEK
jgi:transcriptional regulator with XRE-family HTH domain